MNSWGNITKGKKVDSPTTHLPVLTLEIQQQIFKTQGVGRGYSESCNPNNEGGTQIRTGDKGFAILCLTTWPCRQKRFC